jgi:hypothetical protein
VRQDAGHAVSDDGVHAGADRAGQARVPHRRRAQDR